MQAKLPPKLSPLDPVPRLLDDFHSLSVAKESRAWAFGAIAELVDSALSRSKDDVHIDCSVVDLVGEKHFALSITDNGAGLTFSEIKLLCSIGDPLNLQVNQRGCAGAILRLAKEALILSKSNAGDLSASYVALLSPSLLLPHSVESVGANRPLLPMVRIGPSGEVLEGGEAGAWLVGQRIEASREFSDINILTRYETLMMGAGAARRLRRRNDAGARHGVPPDAVGPPVENFRDQQGRRIG